MDEDEMPYGCCGSCVHRDEQGPCDDCEDGEFAEGFELDPSLFGLDDAGNMRVIPIARVRQVA